MSWRTNWAIVGCRNLGRAIGLNRLLASRGRTAYEDRFQATMLRQVRSGDVVWDVGANQGIYSHKFSSLVGPSGKVIAIEPSPINAKKLSAFLSSLGNTQV